MTDKDDPCFINAERPRRLRSAVEETAATMMRQAMFAKWDGEKFLYGREAAEFRAKEKAKRYEDVT